ncbi:hypothetical protein PoB_005648700 [Plakobranchus ocellatus]|uniref:Uncharacterized protein n=1 Tax=Plakobranchus ocellatus TaxID=259542 RepID=A0AAV4CEK1_9GAST|nr:hypothetical protein PoB_005648700 [Plakobranchus ocellatus]
MKQNQKEEWMKLWAARTTGMIVFKYMDNIIAKSNDPMKLLQRKDQCTIFCRRTQHILLNTHLDKINFEPSPQCHLCDDPQEKKQNMSCSPSSRTYDNFSLPILTIFR